MDIVCVYDDPADAAHALVEKAVEEWAENNDYVDDITAIVIFIEANED